ncbi:ATP-binding protein [Bradyrhizobium betae]
MIASLRGRLFIGLTAIIVVAGMVGSALAYSWAYGEAIEMQDSVLTQIATFAMNAAIRQSQPVSGVDAEAEVAVVELGDKPRDQAEDRRLLELQDGLHNDVYQGRPVRALLRTRVDGSRFAVTQRTEIRAELAGDMALRTLLPIAALVPCLMLLIALVIANSFRPLVRLANELDARRPDDLGRLDAARAPSELQPFLLSINGLLRRMREVMEQQRQFIADAAHELRTPITALCLQAENLNSFDMPPSARNRIDALKSGIGRVKRLVEQLLVLARQDAAPPEESEAVYLDKVAKCVVADLLPDAAARDIDLGFKRTEAIAVDGDSFAFASAIRNLVENAVKFTPDGGRVDVCVYQAHGAAVVEIEDTGPGISQADLDRIFEPFFRGRQASGPGSGLGLSIVKRIIDRAGGTITIANVGGNEGAGLLVIVKLQMKDMG